MKKVPYILFVLVSFLATSVHAFSTVSTYSVSGNVYLHESRTDIELSGYMNISDEILNDSYFDIMSFNIQAGDYRFSGNSGSIIYGSLDVYCKLYGTGDWSYWLFDRIDNSHRSDKILFDSYVWPGSFVDAGLSATVNNFSISKIISEPLPVPEPATYLLLIFGIGILYIKNSVSFCINTEFGN